MVRGFALVHIEDTHAGNLAAKLDLLRDVHLDKAWPPGASFEGMETLRRICGLLPHEPNTNYIFHVLIKLRAQSRGDLAIICKLLEERRCHVGGFES